MKWLLGLLLLANVGLLAYFNLDIIAPKPVQANAPISPEKLKILDAKALEAMPKKVAALPTAPVVETPSTSCYEWGNLQRITYLRRKWLWLS